MIIIALDIGNSRIKLGEFESVGDPTPDRSPELPTPRRTLSLPTMDWNESELRQWLIDVPVTTPWWIASVNRPAAEWLTKWIGSRWPIRVLTEVDLQIAVEVERPGHIGIDRLAGAVAANRLRDPRRAAITVHVGSAITVNLVTADGKFRGGAILPGIGMSARALDEFTDLLPRSPLEELAGPPPAVGTTTLAAIHSGLYWGAVGAMKELVARLWESIGPNQPTPEVFLTGGAAASVAQQLDPAARYVEHLVLCGIALAKPL